MSEKRDQKEGEEPEEAENALNLRFPTLPASPDLPETPRLNPVLPPHPVVLRTEKHKEQGYGKMAIAATAGTSFIMPIIVLGVAGNWADGKFHTAPWLAFGGVVLGFAAGISSLMRIIKKLND